MFSIVHVGVNTQHQMVADSPDEAWEKMHTFLEDRYGANASGMLTNCQVAELMDLPSLVDKGRAYHLTRYQVEQSGLLTSDVQTELSLAYYTDHHGNPTFFVEGPAEVCDHGDPDENLEPICLTCATAVSSAITWEGEPEYQDGEQVYPLLPPDQHGQCHSCRKMIEEP